MPKPPTPMTPVSSNSPSIVPTARVSPPPSHQDRLAVGGAEHLGRLRVLAEIGLHLAGAFFHHRLAGRGIGADKPALVVLRSGHLEDGPNRPGHQPRRNP